MIVSNEISQIVKLLADRPVNFPKIKRTSVEGAYESKHPDYKVQVEYSAKNVWVSLIFEQRPGVWFRLGDFPDTIEYGAAREFFKVRMTSARSDLGMETVPEVVEFLKKVLK